LRKQYEKQFVQIGFYSWSYSRRAIARETLDGVPIRFFILKIIFQILTDLRGVRDQAASAWVRRLEFLKFPNLLIVVCRGHGWKTSIKDRIAVSVSRSFYYCC
jgi:hypothetical protein